MNLVIKDPEVQEAIKRALAKYIGSGASPDS
jgi:hypothetical protein